MFAQEMQIMQQISGLSNAVQGQTPRAGTPSSLYAQETQNSLTNFAMLFKCFNLFCKARDEKLLKVIMQYTDERRYIDLNGRAYDRAARYYEPEMVRKIIDFNLTVKKSNDTPVYRQMADELLLELLKAGQIPLEIFLSNTSSLPFADKLLADMKALKEQAAARADKPGVARADAAAGRAELRPPRYGIDAAVYGAGTRTGGASGLRIAESCGFFRRKSRPIA